MKSLSRREFLKLASIWSGSLALSRLLAACGLDQQTQQPYPVLTQPPSTITTQPATPAVPSSTHTDTPTTEPTQTEPAPTATSAGSPDLVVVRNAEPQELVRQALAAMGGMGQFVPRGASVIIKPNICVGYRSYEYAATTNPWVVAALVELCLDAGASRVRVMDHTYEDKMVEGYARSGIKEQVQAAGGEMVVMPENKYRYTLLPRGLDLEFSYIYEDFLNADVWINVPIAKHHYLAGLTLGMKNLLGVVRDRPVFHHNIGQRLADLNSLLRPTLNIMDAVRILVANGPTGGSLDDVRKLDTLIVSQDIVALDSYATTLFGMRPTELESIPQATAMGLGVSEFKRLRIEEINL